MKKNLKSLFALVLALMLMLTGLVSAVAEDSSTVVTPSEATTPSEPGTTQAPSDPEETQAPSNPSTTEGPTGELSPSEPEETTGPEQTAAPEEPETTVAPTVTKKPTTNNNTTTNKGTAATTEDEEPEMSAEVEAFVTALFAKLGIKVDADKITVTDDTTTIVLDEADGTYGGSTLVFYTSNGDKLVLALSSVYEAEKLTGFDAWRKTADALESEEYAEFINIARDLLAVLLPDLTEEEIDELLVAILTSDAEGLELTAETAPEFWTEDTTVLGVLEQDGYAFYLMLQDNAIVLGICEVEA